MDQKRRGPKAFLQTGPVSPAGPDFPQALLTSRRPVLPPDRAPFVWVLPAYYPRRNLAPNLGGGHCV